MDADDLKTLSDQLDNILAVVGVLPSLNDIINGVWDEPLAAHLIAGSSGEAASTDHRIIIGRWRIENHQMTFYDPLDNVIVRFNLFNKDGLPTETEVYERTPTI